MQKILTVLTVLLIGLFSLQSNAFADPPIKSEHQKLEMNHPIHVKRISNNSVPSGLSPQQVRSAYNIVGDGAGTTIAIVDAYDNPFATADLQKYSTQFGLPSCGAGCFTVHKMPGFVKSDKGWALEESLDVQIAHAVAPKAKILLVEAKSNSLIDLLTAVSYAKSQPGVVSVSMSWGSNEFSGDNAYDSYFNQQGVSFFASSGDSGTGVQWPAVSQNIIGVGGTTLLFNGSSISAETAWNGSGGGISSFTSQPSYQSAFGVSSNAHRAVPDVSFDADPATGVSVYDSFGYNGQTGWFVIGGTSVGAPSWAAINSLTKSATNVKLYADALSSYVTFFRDIITGTNGNCGTICNSKPGYDFITGLGSPLTTNF